MVRSVQLQESLLRSQGGRRGRWRNVPGRPDTLGSGKAKAQLRTGCRR